MCPPFPPPHQVPIIIDGDVRLVESAVSVDYLDAAYPSSGLKIVPTDAADSARARLFVELFSGPLLSSIVALLRADSDEGIAKAKASFTDALITADK